MVFSSLEFLFAFLPVSLLIYFITPLKLRNLVLLAVSLIFYGWGEPKYVLIMLFCIAINYVGGYYIEKSVTIRRSRNILILTIVINLLLLGFFKYFDFIIKTLSFIPIFSGLKPLGIPLPIGISFFVFQSMSYTIDVYRRDVKAQKNFVSFSTYVSLFPQLIAGPIVRYKDVDAQLEKREHSVSKFALGVRRFIAGLAKKLLLANTAAELFENIKAIPDLEQTAVLSWLGIILYTFFIYFDFSGYSDMAIGLGKIFGFDFLENFNYPYISKSITEFWRRWHISLSNWFRDYVYISLGGNRKGRVRTYLNLFIVWSLTGLWHGNKYNYLIWGLYFFVILVIEKLFLGKLLEKMPKVVSHLYALFFIVIGWLIFAFENVSEGFVYLKAMLGQSGGGIWSGLTGYELLRLLPMIAIFIVACTPYPKALYTNLYENSKAFRNVFPFVTFVVMILCVAYLVNSSYNPFIYFIF